MPDLRFVLQEVVLVGRADWFSGIWTPVAVAAGVVWSGSVASPTGASDLLRGVSEIRSNRATLAIVSNGFDVYHPTATGCLSGEDRLCTVNSTVALSKAVCVPHPVFMPPRQGLPVDFVGPASGQKTLPKARRRNSSDAGLRQVEIAKWEVFGKFVIHSSYRVDCRR